MTGITVTASDLEALTGSLVTEETFVSLDRTVRALIQGEIRGDIDTATGRRAAVLNSVYTSVATRLLTNPTGARTVSLGGASVTFGGADDAITDLFTLNASERLALAGLRGRRPSYVRLTGSPLDRTAREWAE